MITFPTEFSPIRIAVVAIAGLAFVGSAMAQMPSGTLDVRGTARVTEGATGETMTVRNTNYSWFSGDRIEVRDGYGILYLNEGNSFGMLEGTDVTLNVDNGTVSGNLESGDLIYAIEGEDRTLVIESEGFEYEARPAEDLAPCLGLTAAGLIQALDTSRDRVTVQSGELEGFNLDRTVERLVEPGEQYEFTQQAARRVEIDLPAEVEEQLDTDRSALPCMVWWTRQEVAGGVIAGISQGAGIGIAISGAIGGYIGYRVVEDDEEPAPESVSP